MSLPNRIIKRLLTTSTSTQNIIQTQPTPSKTHLFLSSTLSSLPKMYLVGATHCGIKNAPANASTSPKLDLGLVRSISPYPTTCAASFTRNAFRAAPVIVSDEILRKRKGHINGLVVNSGCANAITGSQGIEDAWKMVREAARYREEGEENYLVMSTGVVGVNLPIAKVVHGIRSFFWGVTPTVPEPPTLSTGSSDWVKLAEAFMTTDTFPKLRARTFSIRGQEYRIGGIAKGSGMIHPDMGPASTFSSQSASSASSGRPLHATLLGCIMTDAPVSPTSLQSALDYAIDRSFNSISVDGDMSTNDTVVIFANGTAHAEIPSDDPASLIPPTPIDEGMDKEAYAIFRDELTGLAQELAQLVVKDGEGATKCVQVIVKGAPTYEAAHAIASKISTSALVKTALFDEDPNWGRILVATGSVPFSHSSTSPSSPASNNPLAIDPVKVSVTLNPCSTLPNQTPLPVVMNGEPCAFPEERAKEILQEEDFEVVVDLGIGAEDARFWTAI